MIGTIIECHNTNNIDFEQAFIRDDIAERREPFQKPDKFLFTGRQPEKGHRTETQVHLENGNWCMLSGVVTEVGELPSMDEWTSKTCYDEKCNNCTPFEELCPCHKEAFRNRILTELGTLNSQVLVSLAILHFDNYYRQENLPFKEDRVYKVTYVANEGRQFTWEVTKIEDVTEVYKSENEEAANLFLDWEGGFGKNCKSCECEI